MSIFKAKFQKSVVSRSPTADLIKHVLVVFLAAFLGACNGGSGDHSGLTDNAGGDQVVVSEQVEDVTEAPLEPTLAVEVLSPSYNQATTSRAVTVNGIASDQNSSIRSITVNGIHADSEDGFVNWTVNLPVDKTISELKVEAENSNGHVVNLDYAIHISPIAQLFSEPSFLNFDENQNRLFILDALQKEFYVAGADKPSLALLSDSELEASVELHEPRDVVYDKLNKRFIVLDQRRTRPSSQALISVSNDGQTVEVLKAGLYNIIDIALDEDHQTLYYLAADRTRRGAGSIEAYSLVDDIVSVISNATHAGPAIKFPSNLNLINNKAVYIDRASDELVSVNIKTGARTIVSVRDENISLERATNLVSAQNGTTLWAVDSANSQIISINLSSGDRKVLSSQKQGNGPVFKTPTSLAYDGENGRLLLGDSNLNLILSVNISTGDRQYFINNRQGSGPVFEKPTAIEVVANNVAYVFDGMAKSLIKVNLNSGKREIISNGLNEAQGIALKEPTDFAVDEEKAKAWLVDKQLAQIVQIDLGNDNATYGNRSVIATYRAQSTDPELKMPVAIEASGENLFVSDIYHDLVFSTDMSTGMTQRQLNSHLSDGVRIQKSMAVDVDKEGLQLIGVDQVLKAVYLKEIQTGKSRIVSSSTKGSGIGLVAPIDIALGRFGTAYVADAGLNAIVQVDLNSGNRNVLSNEVVGKGPVFKSLSGLSYSEESAALIAVDESEKAVFSIDIANGDRLILSR